MKLERLQCWSFCNALYFFWGTPSSVCRAAVDGQSVDTVLSAEIRPDLTRPVVLLSALCCASPSGPRSRGSVEASFLFLTIVACVVWWNYAACCCCRIKQFPDIALTGPTSLNWGWLCGGFSSFCCIKTNLTARLWNKSSCWFMI